MAALAGVSDGCCLHCALGVPGRGSPGALGQVLPAVGRSQLRCQVRVSRLMFSLAYSISCERFLYGLHVSAP
jgi:hypothetical protein